MPEEYLQALAITKAVESHQETLALDPERLGELTHSGKKVACYKVLYTRYRRILTTPSAIGGYASLASAVA